MFCTNCGFELKSDARFCSSCGQEVRIRSTAQNDVKSLFGRKHVDSALHAGQRIKDDVFNEVGVVGLALVKHREKIIVSTLLLVFLLFNAIGLLAGAVLLLFVWYKRWWYSAGGLLGVVLFIASLVVATNLRGEAQEVGRVYYYAGMEREGFVQVFKLLLAVLIGLEAWNVVRTNKKRNLGYTAMIVLVFLAALPGYKTALEIQRRHTFTEPEMAALHGLFGEQAGRRYILQGDLGKGDVLDVLEVNVNTGSYGDATVEHSIKIRGAPYTASISMRYDKIAAPAEVTYFANGRNIRLAYVAADSMLLWDPARNPNGPPIAVLADALITERNRLVRDLYQSSFDRLRDSLQQITRTFNATVNAGYCGEQCYLHGYETGSGAPFKLRCSLLVLPDAQMDPFIEASRSGDKVWTVNVRRTLEATASQVLSGEWVEIEEVISILPEQGSIGSSQPPVKNPKSVHVQSVAPKPTSGTRRIDNEKLEPDMPAEFPGGVGALNKFISKNMIYPESARQTGASGVVVVSVRIGVDGSLSDMRLIRTKTTDLDLEAIRLISSMPKWTPAVSNGRAVTSVQELPIRFTIR